MCKLARVTPKEYRGAIQYLTNTGFLGQQTASRYTIVTIANWDTYQGNGDAEGQQMASKGPSEGQQRATPEEVKKSSSKKGKKEEVLSVGSPVPEPRKENPKSLSINHDDDRPQPLSETKWATDRDELIAVIRESTGERPDKKLLQQISDGVQIRGGTLRQYLDDIRPRIERLKRKPGFGFFHQHARNWGGSEQRKAPEPEPADKPKAPTCSCKFGQVKVDGEWRFCLLCQMGRDLAKTTEQIAREKKAASEAMTNGDKAA